MREKKSIIESLVKVLILVVMEYTQWVVIKMENKEVVSCLNPCCNGIYSMRVEEQE